MNANELIEWFDGRILYLWDAEDGQYYDSAIADELVPMLRQQQAEIKDADKYALELERLYEDAKAEIETLKAGKIRAYDNGVEDGKKSNTNPSKDLTDEEIRKVADEVFKDYKNWHHYQIDFARAILRKAQEK